MARTPAPREVTLLSPEEAALLEAFHELTFRLVRNRQLSPRDLLVLNKLSEAAFRA